MATVIYADVLFFVNFSMDFISLSATAALAGEQKKPLRASIAAALGALYGVSSAISGLSGLPQTALAVLVGAGMCIVAFGFSGIRRLIRSLILMLGCSALLGGVMTAILSWGRSIPIVPLIASSCIVSWFLIREIRMRKSCSSVEICITYKGRSASFSALCDSGNLMREPFGGTPVILASRDALSPLMPRETLNALLSCDAEELSGMRIRPIPHGSCGEKNMLAAFRADKVTIKNGAREIEPDCYIAPSPHHATYFGGHAASVPTALVP